jgi:predicted negative regulator of RcsB-dependent stress response
MGTLVVVLLLAVAGWVVWKLWKKPDMNNDGVVDAKDVVAAAKEVAVEAKAEAKEVAVKAAEKVKKARKPKAPKV